MEKTVITSYLTESNSPKHARQTFFRYLTLLFVSTLVLFNGFQWMRPRNYGSPNSDLTTVPFQWSNIQPSSSFGFYSCFDEYECARLDVPLDWTASTEDQATQRAAVAVIRLPAKVPVTSPQYGGAILVNPGGPGGSGVSMLLSTGKQLQKVVDTGTFDSKGNGSNLHYDIIGFDPRGVNHTTPTPSCFPDDASRQFWSIARQAAGSLGENDTFPLVWSRNKGLAESCSRKMHHEWDGIGKYVNTPQVASDMVAIIEALGEWREKKGQDIIKRMKCHRQQAAELQERTKWNKGNEKLLYMGFSYGTVLGATFSTIFPDKVHRVMLDGVCDMDDYYSGTWLSNLLDTDLIIGSFFRQCEEAGPVKCPLWSADGIEGIRVKYHAVLKKLTSDPLPVDSFENYSSDVITVSDAMNVVREAVYSPMMWFPILAKVFDQLEKGNGTEIAAAKQDSHISYCRSPTCTQNPYSDDCFAHGGGFRQEMSAAILCTDGPADQLKWQSEDHFAKWQALRGQSRALGDFWAEITMLCANWNVRPAWNFSYAEAAPASSSPINTSHPLLFASTTRDPVTPLRNAHKMQKRFAGAGLVTLEADGHCTIGAPSLCAARSISAYFQTGELPKEGLVCVPDRWPFDDERDVLTLGEEVKEVVEAMEHINRHARGHGGMPLGLW